jgi:hypothetical protein
MQSDRHEFLDQVRAAFPAEPIRGDDAFSLWGGSYPDAAAYKQAVDGKTWEQLDREFIVRRHDALGFLSTQQLVQVLPIYLLSLAREGVMSPALDTVLVKLARPTRAPARERFDAFVAALSGPQRNVVATSLQHLTDQDPEGSPGQAARAALDAVWKDYL